MSSSLEQASSEERMLAALAQLGILLPCVWLHGSLVYLVKQPGLVILRANFMRFKHWSGIL